MILGYDRSSKHQGLLRSQSRRRFGCLAATTSTQAPCKSMDAKRDSLPAVPAVPAPGSWCLHWRHLPTRKTCHNLAMVHMGILRGTMENMRKTIEKHRVSLKYGLILGYHGPDQPTWRIHGGSGLETMDPQDPPLRSSQGRFNQSESGSSNEHSWDH